VWDINTVIFFYDSLFACDSSDGFSLLKENMAYILQAFYSQTQRRNLGEE
jgi:hypothetical protein